MQSFLIFFFFNDTATTEIYTLSLHDALPIFSTCVAQKREKFSETGFAKIFDGKTLTGWHVSSQTGHGTDRKSTRLNSSHSQISYAVFCLKKKNKLRQSILKAYT